MKMLYVNAAFRDGSRTDWLAREYMKRTMPDAEVCELNLGTMLPPYLDEKLLKIYCESVADCNYRNPVFDIPKQFRDAEEIVIAAPFWNFSIPAVLHAYLEMVCTQGITFDVAEDGSYKKLCKARKLTFVITAGGPLPDEDHAFGYIKQLNDVFWGIPEVVLLKAENLDISGNDPGKILEASLSGF